ISCSMRCSASAIAAVDRTLKGEDDETNYTASLVRQGSQGSRAVLLLGLPELEDHQRQDAARHALWRLRHRRLRAERPTAHGNQRRTTLQVQRVDLVHGVLRDAGGDRPLL